MLIWLLIFNGKLLVRNLKPFVSCPRGSRCDSGVDVSGNEWATCPFPVLLGDRASQTASDDLVLQADFCVEAIST